MKKVESNFKKISLLTKLGEIQKKALLKVFELIEAGQVLKKSDLEPFNDFTRMSHTEIVKITKIASKQLSVITAKDPTIKNSDGSYSLVNLIQYLRGRGSTAIQEGSMEAKRAVETQILEKKLAEFEGQYTLNSDVEIMLADRLERLLICLDNEPKANAYLYENKTRDEARELLQAFIKRAITEYRDSFIAEAGNAST
jgi:hypothetical protein